MYQMHNNLSFFMLVHNTTNIKIKGLQCVIIDVIIQLTQFLETKQLSAIILNRLNQQ